MDQRTEEQISKGKEIIWGLVYLNPHKKRKSTGQCLSDYPRYVGTKGISHSEIERLILIGQETGAMGTVYPYDLKFGREGFTYHFTGRDKWLNSITSGFKSEIGDDIEELKSEKKIRIRAPNDSGMYLCQTKPLMIPIESGNLVEIFSENYRWGLKLLADYVEKRRVMGNLPSIEDVAKEMQYQTKIVKMLEEIRMDLKRKFRK